MQVLGHIPHPQNMEILQARFIDIGQLIISVGIGRDEEETILQDKVAGIADNAFDHLAVVEVDPHPETGNNWRILMKMKRLMPYIAIEGLYKEDCLGALRRNLFNLSGIDQTEANRF